MDRRDFLKIAAAAAALTAGKISGLFGEKSALGADGAGDSAPLNDDPNRVIAVRGNSPVAMFRTGIAQLGGMTAFVKAGQKVVVKPNIGWDKTPELAANTNPELVSEIVRQALAAGAATVSVFDNTCNYWRNCYKNSGIESAVIAAGGKMIPANEESAYETRTFANAKVLKTAKIHREILACDVLINVPVLKNHGGALMTAAIKNYMGVVWDRRFMHGSNLPQTIAELPFYRRADLNIIDAYRVVASHGPQGGNANDVKLLGYQLLSRDMVAVDALATKLLNYELAKVPYIEIAEKLGLGTAHPANDSIVRLTA